mgnify:CR=1 FL=1
MSKKVFSLICAVSCSLIWGSAFIAQDSVVQWIVDMLPRIQSEMFEKAFLPRSR